MNNVTELVFIIDQSGSMSGLEKDTIGGFNSMLKKQRNNEGVCHISTIFFADESKVIHNRKNIESVEPLTDNDYCPGGCTALLDALGDAMKHTAKVQEMLAEDERADKVMFVIITDGQENASRRYTANEIKRTISIEQEKYGWEFIFLGANIDAVGTAESYGIRSENATNFVCDEAGVDLNFCALSETIDAVRKVGSIPKGWNRNIEKDYKKRGK